MYVNAEGACHQVKTNVIKIPLASFENKSFFYVVGQSVWIDCT
jgi:hypothetical protein